MTATLDHDLYMRQAILLARNNRAAPFGAVLVHRKTGEVVCGGWNRTRENPTWHGEIDVLNRHAVVANPNWPELTLYTTAEPCPMCQSAILWAGIAEVVFGTSIPTLQIFGWGQIDIRAAEVIARFPGHTCRLIGGVLEAECDPLFQAAAPTR
jgi:tRNA(Arg) A34 adenosine deaminase TadA